MENVVQKAKDRLLKLEAEATELRQFLRVYKKLSGDDLADPKASPIATLFSDQEPSKEQEFNTRDEIVQAARQALKSAFPNPMIIGDLYETLVNQGIRIGGQNPKGNLSAKLAPPDDLEFVRDEGWYYRPPKSKASSLSLEASLVTGGVPAPPNFNSV